MRFFWNTLKCRFGLIVFLAVIPVLVFVVFNYAEQRKWALENVRKDLLSLAKDVSREQLLLCEMTRGMLAALAKEPSIKSLDPEACSKIFGMSFKASLFSFYANVGLTDRQGNLVCSVVPSGQPINLSDRDYFQKALETLDLSVGHYQVGRVSGKDQISFGYPVVGDAGESIGVVFASLSLAWFDGLSNTPFLPDEGTITLIDGEGAVLWRNSDKDKWLGKSSPETEIVKTVLAEGKGITEAIGLDGKTKIYGFFSLWPIPGRGYVYTGVPSESVFSRINKTLFWNLTGVAVAICMGLLASWIFAYSFVIRRVNQLVRATQEVARGNLKVHTGLDENQGEVGVLGNAFDKMAASLEQREAERKQAEKARAESELMLRTILTASPVGIALSIDRKLVWANQTMVNMFGFDNELELIDQSGRKRYASEEEFQRAGKELYNNREPGAATETEAQMLRKDGLVFDAHIRLTHLDQVGSFDNTEVVVVADISARKKAEQSLREKEESYRLLLDTMNEGVGVISQTGVITYINRATCQLLGYPEEALTGRPVTDFLDEANQKIFREQLLKRKDFEPGTYELGWTTKDGRQIYTIVSARPIRDAKGVLRGSIAVVTDITERKRYEDELKHSEQSMRMLIEESPLGISIFENDKYVYANPELVNLLGCENQDQILGRPFDQFVAYGHRRLFVEGNKMALAGKKTQTAYELQGLKLTGETADLIMWPKKIERHGHQAILAFVMDVTETKKLRLQLQQSQKMEAIGTLAGGIAHDFNNILSAITGYTELSIMDLPEGQKSRSYLEKVLKAANRARDLVRQILTFSRQNQVELVPVNVGPIVKEAINFLRASIPTTIDIRQSIQDDLGLVRADPTQIHQILMNLCTNSAHAMREKGGSLSIELSNVNLDSKFSGQDSEIGPGQYIRLVVSDTGCGVPREILNKIFDPYFTTKPVGDGTGLGLAVIHGIIKGIDGAITVYSEPGVGSTFNVYIPRIPEGNVPNKIVPLTSLRRGLERILFVDDEPALVEIAENLLQLMGYKVEARTSSVDALKLFQSKPEEFDLVITDLSMPQMTGLDLARELLNIRPDIPVILCTGFSNLVTEESALASGIRAVIMKPIVSIEMAEKVRSVLDEASK